MCASVLTRISEVSCQGHTMAPIFLENVSERKGRKILGKSSFKQLHHTVTDMTKRQKFNTDK